MSKVKKVSELGWAFKADKLRYGTRVYTEYEDGSTSDLYLADNGQEVPQRVVDVVKLPVNPLDVEAHAARVKAGKAHSAEYLIKLREEPKSKTKPKSKSKPKPKTESKPSTVPDDGPKP